MTSQGIDWIHVEVEAPPYEEFVLVWLGGRSWGSKATNQFAKVMRRRGPIDGCPPTPLQHVDGVWTRHRWRSRNQVVGSSEPTRRTER